MLGLSRVLVLFIAALVGCTTSQPSFVQHNPNTFFEKIQPDEGVVLVKLIGVQSLSMSNAKWHTLKVTNARGEQFEIQDAASPGASYSLFFGTLPQGTYQMSQLETIGNAPGLLLALMASDFREISADFGPFTVKSGAVTNLGTVVFALPKDKQGPPFKAAVLAGEVGLTSAFESNGVGVVFEI